MSLTPHRCSSVARLRRVPLVRHPTPLGIRISLLPLIFKFRRFIASELSSTSGLQAKTFFHFTTALQLTSRMTSRIHRQLADGPRTTESYVSNSNLLTPHICPRLLIRSLRGAQMASLTHGSHVPPSPSGFFRTLRPCTYV